MCTDMATMVTVSCGTSPTVGPVMQEQGTSTSNNNNTDSGSNVSDDSDNNRGSDGALSVF